MRFTVGTLSLFATATFSLVIYIIATEVDLRLVARHSWVNRWSMDNPTMLIALDCTACTNSLRLQPCVMIVGAANGNVRGTTNSV